MRQTHQDNFRNGSVSSGTVASSSSSLRYGGGGIRPRSPSHAAKNKTPEDRVCEFGWMLAERDGKLLCRACNLNLDHTRRSTIVEHLRSRKHQRYLEVSGFNVSTAHAAVAPIVLMEIDDDSIVGNTQSSGPPSRQQSPIPPGMTGPYLLKKETHCNTILDELMKDETFTDVTLTAEGQHIKAHRIILCLSSKYFKEVLSKDSNAKNIIFFRDIKFEELKNIISFIYTGEVTVDATDLESFMKTAELLEVTSLCEGQKNFPKGFPLYRNPEPSSSEIPKVSAATKRSSTSDAHSPPLKSRKVNAEAAVQRPSRKFHQAAASYSPPVIKPEPLSQSDIEEETTKEAGDNKEDIYSDLGSKDTDRANEEKETHTGSSSDYEETFQAGRKEEAEPPGVGDITTTTTPGRCPFCPATQILFTGSAILTHLQVSHSDETAYPCENCYRVFTTKSIFLGHHRDCAR